MEPTLVERLQRAASGRVSHRALQKLSGICALAALVTLLLCTTGLEAEQARPANLILILADDLGYGELGCYGQKKIKTPNLDKMAAQGLRFTQHYAGNAVCAPSRCVLMTGKHSGHAQIRNNTEMKPDGQQPIAADTATLARLLHAAGYVTGMIGKWGLGVHDSSGDPQKQGFDHFFGDPGSLAGAIGAAANDLGEGAIESDVKLAGAAGAAQPERHVQTVQRKDRPRVGGPPANRQAVVVPGEDAAAISLQEALGTQITAHGDQAGRIRQLRVAPEIGLPPTKDHFSNFSRYFLASWAAGVLGYFLMISLFYYHLSCFSVSVLL